MDAYNHLRRCRTVVLEANHDIDMLRMGPYPFPLKQRILSPGGHLSNADCAGLCCGLARSDTKRIILAHLSHENNTPAIAYQTVRAALDREGHTNFALSVAMRDQPGCVLPGGQEEQHPIWGCQEEIIV